MGMVGTGAFLQFYTTMKSEETPHFTQTFGRHYSFVAKHGGVIGVAFSSQFYGRKPNSMVIAIKKNGKVVAFNGGPVAQSTSVFLQKEAGDEICVDMEFRASGSDVGCDYWLSAMADEPIEFK